MIINYGWVNKCSRTTIPLYEVTAKVTTINTGGLILVDVAACKIKVCSD